MEVETIGQYVASNGKNYYFFTDRVRKSEVKKNISKKGIKFNGNPCRKCNETERYVSTGDCVACIRERARLQHERRKAKHD
ncbi:hypothetical protein NON99_004521 [Salmonella enterica]|nr:hypothetical protein [Salmonella enterica]